MLVIPLINPREQFNKLCTLPIVWQKITAGEHVISVPMPEGDIEFYIENLQQVEFEHASGTALFDPRTSSITITGTPSFESNVHEGLVS